MKKTIVILILIETTLIFGQLPFPIVGTGVTKFYNDKTTTTEQSPSEPFYGQDGHYIKNVPSYTDNSDGTVTDNITGLMWQADMGDKITFDQAKIKADTLSLGGHTDWRVPTIKELYSLILFTGRASGEGVIDKFIDTTVFDQPIGDPRPIDAQTLSSTEYVSTTMNGNATVFGVNFLDGRIKGYPKNKTWYFRMVRGNTTYGKNDFVDNKDGTITDRATGLMWQQADDGTARDWEEALEYAENLELASHDDWRLPSTKELQSIVDYTRAPATTNSPAIDPLFACTEIEDPDGNPGQYPYYWSGTTHLDGPNPGGAAAYVAFGEAQGKMNGTLMDVHGAGAQRSDPKSGDPADYPQFMGPQGDVRLVYNYVRCVRYADNTAINGKVQQTGMNSNLRIQYDQTSHAVSFSVNGKEKVTLQIYNCKGICLATLENQALETGRYSYRIPEHCLSTQVLIAVLKNGTKSHRQKIFNICGN
jgi:hypothetical protein